MVARRFASEMAMRVRVIASVPRFAARLRAEIPRTDAWIARRLDVGRGNCASRLLAKVRP